MHTGSTSAPAHAAAALLKARSNAGLYGEVAHSVLTTSTSPRRRCKCAVYSATASGPAATVARGSAKTLARRRSSSSGKRRVRAASEKLRERDEAGRVELRRLRLERGDERRQQRRAVLREDVRRRHRGVVLRGLVAGLQERRRERGGERRELDEREASGRLRKKGGAKRRRRRTTSPARAPSGRRAPARSGGAAARWRRGRLRRRPGVWRAPATLAQEARRAAGHSQEV